VQKVSTNWQVGYNSCVVRKVGVGWWVLGLVQQKKKKNHRKTPLDLMLILRRKRPVSYTKAAGCLKLKKFCYLSKKTQPKTKIEKIEIEQLGDTGRACQT